MAVVTLVGLLELQAAAAYKRKDVAATSKTPELQLLSYL
jgi:hypothetical protein